MAKDVLTPAAIENIRRMYVAVGPTGRPLHTQQSLAMAFGVGETTIRRVVLGIGRYAASKSLAELEDAAIAADSTSAAEIQASLQRLLKELKPAADLAQLKAGATPSDPKSGPKGD